MELTKEQQALLDGAQGETMAKVMKTLIMYGQIFGAEKLVPVTSRYNHLVTSFGLKALEVTRWLYREVTGTSFSKRGLFRGRNSRWTPGLWTPMCPPTSCRTWSSKSSCTASRTSTRTSCANWA